MLSLEQSGREHRPFNQESTEGITEVSAELELWAMRPTRDCAFRQDASGDATMFPSVVWHCEEMLREWESHSQSQTSLRADMGDGRAGTHVCAETSCMPATAAATRASLLKTVMTVRVKDGKMVGNERKGAAGCGWEGVM